MPTLVLNRDCNKAVLDYVRRYTIGIEQLISESIPGDARAALRRLLARRQLREHKHPLGFPYVVNSGSPKLSESAFIRRYALVRFCQPTISHRRLLTRSETEQYFPDIFRHGMPGGHYIDTSDDRPRFGHVRVDAVPARTSRLVSRATELVGRYCRNAAVRQLISQEQFEITFVVATIPKARRLQMEFYPLEQSGVRFRAHAIPELLELIAPLTDPTPVGTARQDHSPANRATKRSITHSHIRRV